MGLLTAVAVVSAAVGLVAFVPGHRLLVGLGVGFVLVVGFLLGRESS